MKKSIKCPYCCERITTYNVPTSSFHKFNPRTYKVSHRVGEIDISDDSGFCDHCGGIITIEMFEEVSK
jgi:hypothetical protein